MKKCVVLVAVAVLVAFAAPAFAVTNPFMDVPMNHWAYDAIGQLAAKGVLSGYPDGTYKGKQPTTRYEMASALARALAVVDMTKASKQDVEMLKKLVVEFKDELDALGVKVDQIDKRVAVLESRLGGWKISGFLRADFYDLNDDSGKGGTDLARARLHLERWFGEDESIHFFARIDGNDDLYGTGRQNNLRFSRFYAEVPTWWDTKMTIGRFVPDMEADYYLDGTTSFSKFMGMGQDSWLTDRAVDGLMVQKNFGLGRATFYAAHPESDLFNAGYDGRFGLWEFFLMGQLQFTEQFGFDLGVQYFAGDDSSEVDITDPMFNSYKVDNLWTVFAGLRFNFNDSIALKGMYYYQDKDAELHRITGGWTDYFSYRGMDSNSNAWRAVIDIKQDLLKFTSLWLEYNHLEQGFVLPQGKTALVMDSDLWNNSASTFSKSSIVRNDTNIWRVAAQQNWNEKWSTFLLYAHFSVDNTAYGDVDANQYGIGVAYQYNPNVGFGLSYNRIDGDDDFNHAMGFNDDISVFRFRTQVTF